MIEWLKWKIARREMAELQARRVAHEGVRRWLAEFGEVAAALDWMQTEVTVGGAPNLREFRDELRKQYPRPTRKATPLRDGFDRMLAMAAAPGGFPPARFELTQHNFERLCVELGHVPRAYKGVPIKVRK